MAQNSIIELQTINYIIKKKDLGMLKRANIIPAQFSEVYQEMITFIFNHENKYKVVPDEETMIANFGQDYIAIDVQESSQYLIEKLTQHIAFLTFAKDFAVAKGKIDEGDVETALSFLRASAESTLKLFGTSGIGTDIIKDPARIQDYERRLEGNEEDKAFSLGIDELDGAFGGLLRDDIMLLFARLAHGKSYIMTYFAHQLHKQGLKVLFYSGEMEASQVGYRYDSIDSHFSNKALLFGKHDLGSGRSHAQYKTYIDKLSRLPNYFTVVTPADLGGRFINLNDINRMIDEISPDVIFIDQLSLVDDIRSNKNTQRRERYGNIMADLRVVANTKRIPIVIAAQANRQSATKDEEGEFVVPEISHIADSDDVGHHCTRAIAFATNKLEDGSSKRIMKMAVRKNRHGDSAEFKLEVDFEHGIFTELKQKPLRADLPNGVDGF